MARLKHIEKQLRTTTITVAASPYAMLIADEYVGADASGGETTIQLPALATVDGLVFVVAKEDASGNAVVLDPNGAETINGVATFGIFGQNDTVTILATLTGWRIIDFLSGVTLVPNDPVEFQILDRSAADILFVANRGLAEVNADAQADVFSVFGYTRFVVTIDLTVVGGGATQLFIGSRQSSKLAPNKATIADWSYYNIDNIDTSTGQSTTPPYQINIPIDGARRYTRSFRTWGTWASPIVWCNAAGCRGIVYATRFVGG